MREKPRVLVAAPIFDGMRYCIDRFISEIKFLDYENYDILLIDNSKSDMFSKDIRKKYDVNVMYSPLNVSNMEKIVQSRNKILDYAFEKFYDYVLMMDCDVIPPVDIIDRLLSHKKDIVSGLYYGLFSVGEEQSYKPVAWKNASDEEIVEIKLKFPDFIKKNGIPRRHLTKEEVRNGNLQEVIIPSAGCMLISRDVFEKIRYGILDVSGKYNTSDDIFFCKKAYAAGFNLYCDTSIKCEHLLYGKFGRGRDDFIHPSS